MSCGVRILHEWRLANYWVRVEETEPGIVRFTQARSECSLPPDSSEFFPTEKPMGTANEIIHLAKALEQQREATKEAWRAAALRAWYDCIDCGSHIKVDEDGCCSTCGRDADFIDLDYVQRRMTTMERENEELPALCEKAERCGEQRAVEGIVRWMLNRFDTNGIRIKENDWVADAIIRGEWKEKP